MKKKMIKLVEKHIHKLYTESVLLLKDQNSYEMVNIDKTNVILYLYFLENALKKPYNRLSSLATFLGDPGQLMTDQMYPFGMISSNVKNKIIANSKEATKLGLGLDASEINPNFTILWKE